MSGPVARLREAADWMRLEDSPFFMQMSVWLARVASDAAMRAPRHSAADHAVYLDTGERANAIAAADAYLAGIHAPERSAP